MSLAALSKQTRELAQTLSEFAVGPDSLVFSGFDRLKIKVLADGIEESADQLDKIADTN